MNTTQRRQFPNRSEPRQRGAIRCSAHALMAGILAFAALSPTGAQERPMLVEYLPVSAQSGDGISGIQADVLDQILRDPGVLALRVGHAAPEPVIQARALSIELPGSQEILTIDDLVVEALDSGYALYTRDQLAMTSTTLVVIGKDVAGTIDHNGATYAVQPLGDGLTAVFHYDTEYLGVPPETEPDFEIPDRDPDEAGLPPEQAPPTAQDSRSQIDVLVVYPSSVRRGTGSIETLMTQLVLYTNRAYRNSGVTTSVRVVHSYETSYRPLSENDFSKTRTDLQRLRTRGDGYVDDVFAKRDQYAADVVIMLFRHAGNFCGGGRAYLLDHRSGSSEWAFGVSGIGSAGCIQSDATTFAHEIGHIQGASHNPEEYTTTAGNPYAYGHGLCNAARNWRTVMSYNTGRRCEPRIQHFSTPSIFYRGTATGDHRLRNVARVINETAVHVANFRQATTSPPPEDDDHGDNCSDGTRVALPSTTRGSLERSGDVDAFRFSVSRAGELRAETTGSTDTLGRLYRGTNEIGRNDDSGAGRNFRIVKDVQPGDHCVEVRGWNNRTGDYSLRVEPSGSPPPPAAPAIARFGDLNGDGKDDVLLRHARGSWFYYPMNGRTHIRAQRGTANLTTSLEWRPAGIGDFNGDGKDDVLLRHARRGSWFYYPMNGRSHIRAQRGTANLTTNLEWQLAGIGDFNGDGRDDVMMRHARGSWFYYPMNGRSHIRAQRGTANLTTNLEWQPAGIGDFNGDGRDDVMMRHARGSWFYYPMNGRSHIRAQRGTANLTTSLDWQPAGIGDLNGDGRDDVLLRKATGSWFYYPMNGRSHIRAQRGTANLTTSLDWQPAGIGDLNGDGRDDVLLRKATGSWFYYPMNGRLHIRAQRGTANLTTDTRWAIPHPAASGQSAGESARVLPLLTVSSNEFQRGIVRIINHSERSGTVAIHGVDGAGTRYGPATLTLEAKESVHLDSAELEDGSPSKGLLGGLGDGTGNWRLELTSELDIEPLAYVRNVHGAFTPLHEIARTTVEDSGQAVHHVPLFPSAGDGVHDSQLRLINLGDAVVAATIGGVDDAGNPATDTVRLTIPGGQTRTLTPQDLETPGPDLEDVRGGLGDGEGNWRLSVVADGDIAVMSLLLRSDTVANLSASRPRGSSHDVPFVPASNESREGYVRIINHSDEFGDITVIGIDDAGYSRRAGYPLDGAGRERAP